MPIIVETGQDGKIVFDLSNERRVLQINTGNTLAIFRERSVRSNPLVSNFFGLFQLVDVGRDGKFVYGKITRGKHKLTSRRKGCTWNPKTCGGKFTTGEVTVCPIGFQDEVCPDVVWNSCWERIMGVGNEINDFFATAEGTALIEELIEGTYESIGNDLHDLLWFGHHPLIDEANSTKSYLNCGISEEEWACFYDQQKTCGGILTQVDYLKAQGHTQYTCPIFESNVNGSDYTGDPTQLFNRLIKKMPSKMKKISKRGGQNAKPVILVSPSIYYAYEEHLTDKFQNITEGYYLYIDGANTCLLYTSPSPRDQRGSRMPSSA